VKRGLLGTKTTVIDKKKLLRSDYQYNPGIYEWAGKLLMVYRYERHLKPAKIGLAILDPKTYEPLENVPLDLKAPAEDPRLFEHAGRLLVSYCHNYWQYIAELDVVNDFKIKWCRPAVVHTGKPEKNWTFFSSEGRLLSIYKLPPKWEVHEWNPDFTHKATHSSRHEVSWKWGELRGGTPPVLFGDRLYTFFHSSFNYPIQRIFNHKVYVAGWLSFSPEPPYRPIEMSSEPIMWPDADLIGKHVPCAVTFPCGAMKIRDRWLVSAGDNDVRCVLHEVDDQEMRLETMEIK
jgi:predicted GH43/DUF377 family glycosyl hydrolase